MVKQECMSTVTTHITIPELWKLMEEICDPEIPVLTITDLGMVRDIQETDGYFEVIITPTYSGCPAMDMITRDIRTKLDQNRLQEVRITRQLSPAWTTDWMTEEAKQKLKDYGIAPPSDSKTPSAVACPQCGSEHTELVSQFGSTPCKALYRCLDCREPFDHFKCH